MKNINLEEVKRFARLKANIAFSNEIYINENKLYKIYSGNCEFYLKQNLNSREQFVEYLINLEEFNGCVVPNGKIYNQNQFVGVCMKYYRNYFNLYNLLFDEIDWKVKINILKQTSIILKNIHERDIVHGDIHLGNIITNLNDTRIIDLDESFFNFSDDNYDKQLDIKNLITVILSIIYDCNLEDIIPFEMEKRKRYIKVLIDKINLNSIFKDYIKDFYFYQNVNLVYPIQFLDGIDQEQIQYDKKKLSKF